MFCGSQGSLKLFPRVLAIEAIFVIALRLHSLSTGLAFTLMVQKQWHLGMNPGGSGHCTPHLLEPEEKKNNRQLQLRMSLMNQYKIVRSLNCSPRVHAFLIFYVMRWEWQKALTRHVQVQCSSRQKVHVPLSESGDELATLFMEHHCCLNEQLTGEGIGRHFLKNNEESLSLPGNKW